MASTKASTKDIKRLAKGALGIEKLRPGQLQAIEAVKLLAGTPWR